MGQLFDAVGLEGAELAGRTVIFFGCYAGHGCQVLPFNGKIAHAFTCITGFAMERAASSGFGFFFFLVFFFLFYFSLGS